jgi:hypothetical protein
MLKLPSVFSAGETGIQVLVLRKILNAKPQQFMLVLKDSRNVQHTEFGAEGEVCNILKAVGISQPEIEKLFQQAKFSGDSAHTTQCSSGIAGLE